MRGHITKRGHDSYTIVVNLGTDPATGKRKQQWVSIKGTKNDAEKRLAELLHQLDTGTFMRPGKTTVKDYLERWLKDYASSNLSPRGLDRYTGIINRYFIPQFGNLPLTALKPEHLQKHYAECQNDGLSSGTIRYHHAVIHKSLQTAVEWGLVSRNAADAVKPPRRTHKEMQIWNEDEVNRFLEVAKDSPYYTLFFTALYTGMRRSELLALTWQDVDLIYGQISVKRGLHQLRNGDYAYCQTKSAKGRRTIALPPSAILQLRLYREKQRIERAELDIHLTDDSLVFSQYDGKPLRPNTVTRAWETLAVRADIKVIRLHDARHTHASLMLKQGVHPKIVQERLGHSSIEITLDIYSHVVPGLQDAAAKRFDELLNPTANKIAQPIG